MQLGHAVVVRVRFSCYVQAAGARSANHIEFMDYVEPTCTLNVNDVDRRSDRERIGKYFLEPRQVSFFGRSTSTNMHVDGVMVLRGILKHLEDFPIGGRSCVSRTHTNRQRAAMQSFLEPRLDLI